mmetsp:Transcript_6952/g.9034  ORF Transcript_6952/g.9034 Transcript_6952/m.9034 type:complete len:227 (-) Transcript_6952:149-829(-)|eukprot:CAMPEP_0198144434 /NCGR_PEP_ID=MMETSP1443-20131203/15761_1 /TAXON_ID=186043 /ORGANISM="Entomoneis sp., Strain CCMP2396" /LENGTH=226 /DNA_ID=CAMNT_0043807833 /DNA_START=164 /DNA_END=844 /DNA_ORIENTATION=-
MSAQDLWDAAKPLISTIEEHPFLSALLDGSLPIENFRYYIIQDLLYLDDFADCLDRLSTHEGIPGTESQRLDEFAKADAETAMHDICLKQWGITAEGARQKPNTLLYTSFLHRTIATRPHGEGLTALLPCYWVYMHIGKLMSQKREILGDTVTRPRQYDEWIDLCGGESFEAGVMEYIDLVDSYCKTANEVELGRMKDTFALGCKMEHMFWDQAQEKMEWPEMLSS